MKEMLKEILSILDKGEPHYEWYSWGGMPCCAYRDNLYEKLSELVKKLSSWGDLRHSEVIKKPVEELCLSEIATLLRFIVGGERFYDGHISIYIDNGKLKRLLVRLNDIVIDK